MKVSFVFAMLSAAAAVVALPATGTVKEVSNVVERAAAVATTTAPAKAAAKKDKKKIKVKPEVIPTAVKPVPTPASKSPKWSKNTHPKENVPKDFGKKKTGK